jgi:putative transposase
MRVTTAPWGQEVALVKRKRHSPEQIIRKLREAERLLEEGVELPEVMRRLEISTQTYHRWKQQYHSMRPEDVVELKNLRKQNTRLKKIVADQALDIDMLKEVARGNW